MDPVEDTPRSRQAAAFFLQVPKLCTDLDQTSSTFWNQEPIAKLHGKM